MGKKILDSKALYIFLSIVIAIALWFYVTSQNGNRGTNTISNIPVTFAGAENLAARDLMIVGDVPTATVRVTASPSVLAKLNKETIQATVDVSHIEEAAEYTLAYTITLPDGVSREQVQFVSGETGNVSFTVARHTTRNVEIRGQFVGTVAEGYLPGAADEFLFSPETLTVSGRAELVNQIAYVLVTVDGEELTDPVSGEYSYQFIGAHGDVLENLDVECARDTIHASYPILATAEIDLAVKLVAGGGVGADDATYELDVDRITIAGSKDAVAAISGEPHIVATIDLSAVQDGDEVVCTIPLADELTNISGITEVKATISLNKTLKTREVSATHITCINIPEGWRASVVTKQLTVTVRGSARLVDAVTPDSVRVVVDLEDAQLTAGQHTMQAMVYLDSVGTVDEIGVMNKDYKVVVTLSRG